MPSIRCPIEGCEYQTPEVEAVLAAALMTVHVTSHKQPDSNTSAARAEKVKRPSISSAATTEEWLYFKSRWSDYVRATRLDGTDKIINC